MLIFRAKSKKTLVVTFLSILAVIALLSISTISHGIPYFARKYDFQCNTCHVIPPKLNQFGEGFRANGYRLPEIYPTNRTWPFALWITERGELEHSKDFEKTFPNRVEVISGGPIGEKFSYFVEWRVVSLETESNGDLRDRSGRFEDLFINYEFIKPFTLRVGQYRLLNQVDDSLKLGLSTPVVIGTSIAGDPSSNPRKTSLRSFAPANRSPAIGLGYHTIKGENSADGWFNIISLPFPGEFSIPLTDEARDEASFEFEFDPKGVFFESFYRWGLSSIGANLFVDDDRSTGSVLGVYNIGPLFSTIGFGYGRESGDTSFRFSWENEFIPIRFFSVGARVDHRSDLDNGTAFVPNINIQWPLTKWTLRLVLEQRVQVDNHATLAELSVVF
ncbi:MAG: hypothetical protein HYW01_00395 [Deltaproteobacteria bacterium]|nr:hypothetical protein [Deltaproteobacteria bacterium]